MRLASSFAFGDNFPEIAGVYLKVTTTNHSIISLWKNLLFKFMKKPFTLTKLNEDFKSFIAGRHDIDSSFPAEDLFKYAYLVWGDANEGSSIIYFGSEDLYVLFEPSKQGMSFTEVRVVHEEWERAFYKGQEPLFFIQESKAFPGISAEVYKRD